MDEKKAKELREPFKPSQIGKLPKGGVMLDFVGHAATTDRLLQVDPEWTWEPLALTPEGLPALDRAGNLWIKLTVCGVTRLGVGDGASAKVCIGDAIRNAAMRFGVALDLWAKEDLHADEGEKAPKIPAKEKTPEADVLEARLLKLAGEWKALVPEFDLAELTAKLDLKRGTDGYADWLTKAAAAYENNVAVKRSETAFPIPKKKATA